MTELKTSNVATGGLTLESSEKLASIQTPKDTLRGFDKASVLDDLGMRTG